MSWPYIHDQSLMDSKPESYQLYGSGLLLLTVISAGKRYGVAGFRHGVIFWVPLFCPFPSLVGLLQTQ